MSRFVFAALLKHTGLLGQGCGEGRYCSSSKYMFYKPPTIFSMKEVRLQNCSWDWILEVLTELLSGGRARCGVIFKDVSEQDRLFCNDNSSLCIYCVVFFLN